MKKKILLTRPRTASERWALILARHGLDCVIEPLLAISSTHTPCPEGKFQAILMTSSHAVDAWEVLPEPAADFLRLPCFCVGAATGTAARAAGFVDVRCGAMDSAALAQLVIETLGDKTQPILYIAGETVDEKAQNILSKHGFILTVWPVYRATTLEDFSAATKDMIAHGNIAALPVFSPRSARTLVSIIDKNNLAWACRTITAIGFSQAVTDVLQTLPWRRLCVAQKPEEEEVLTCLQSEISMMETEPAPATLSEAAPTPRARCDSKPRFVWLLVLGALLACLSAAVIFNKKSPAAQNMQELAVLEHRLNSLESRSDIPLERIAPPPIEPADTTGLGERVKSLEAQLAQDESKINQAEQTTQKQIAAAFAFWELRAAAEAGHSFVSQLAALRAATANDAFMAEQTARLENYSSSPVPTLSQLREALALEKTPEPSTPDGTSLWARVKTALRPLISVHSVHDAHYTTVENALESGDAVDVLETVKALPGEEQKNLSAWREKLEARIAIDNALQALAAHFLLLDAVQGRVP